MIPDYCEAITAYRCWDVFPNGLLVGQAHTEPWPPYEPFVGRCGRAISEDHIRDGQWVPAPVMTCDCGIHAYLSHEDAELRILQDPNSLWSYDRPDGRAWGALKLWGKLVEHEQGYRAQFAYPSALWCEDAALAEKIAELYGVPCEVKALDSRKQRAKDDYVGLCYVIQWYSTAQPLTYTVNWTPSWNPVTAPPAPPPSITQTPSLAQVKALGMSKHQRKQAAQREAQKEAAAAKKRDLIQQYLAKGAVELQRSEA